MKHGMVIAGVFAAVAASGCTESTPSPSTRSQEEALTVAQCTYFTQNDKVTICHHTSSTTKPYTIIRTSASSCGGHTTHDGDYVAVDDPTCNGEGCLPDGAPVDSTVECCQGLTPVEGVCRPEAPPPQGPLYVTNQVGNRVTAYATSANGDVAPVISIEGPSTQLNAPRGIARDRGRFTYVANAGSNAITEYATNADGDVFPVRVIQGDATHLTAVEELAIDGADYLYASDQADNEILVFAPYANGNAAPVRIISGPSTLLRRPMGVALDSTGRLYVANLGVYGDPSTQSVTVYAPGATGDAAPLFTIAGPDTAFFNPLGITVDAAGSVYVANYGNTDEGPGNSTTRVTVYAPGSTGNATPSRVIVGGALQEPTGPTVDASGRLFVPNFWSHDIVIYGPWASGAATPDAQIAGPSTLLDRPVYSTF